MKRQNNIGEKDSVIAIILLLLLLFVLLKSRGWVYAALTVGIVSLLSSQAAYSLHRFWTFLAETLGSISGVIILFIVFIVMVIPTSVLKKWFGKKDIVLSKKNMNSGFRNRNHQYTRTDLENPW